MSWDIYGNKLARGHCEVHPGVAQEYPCYICIEEKKASSGISNEQLSQQDAYLEKRVSALEKIVDDLTKPKGES